MIKLIVTDIDGTLVPDGSKDVNPRLFDIIRELKSEGIVFAACSGRSITSLSNLFEPVLSDVILCGENGGYIKCRDYTIATHFMNPKFVKELIHESRMIDNIVPCLCTPEIMYVERAKEEDLTWLNDGYMTNTVVLDDLLLADLNKVIKFSVLDKISAANNSGKRFNKKWHDILSVVESGLEWLDMTDKEVNKGRAVQDIQNYLDIKPENTMVFGDNHNDLSMLENAKYSFAVKNARKEVLRKAKFITDSNLNDGVIKILEKVLKGDLNFDRNY